MNATFIYDGYEQWSSTINVHSYIYEHTSCMINDHRNNYEHWSSMIIDIDYHSWRSMIVAMKCCWSYMISVDHCIISWPLIFCSTIGELQNDVSCALPQSYLVCLGSRLASSTLEIWLKHKENQSVHWKSPGSWKRSWSSSRIRVDSCHLAGHLDSTTNITALLFGTNHDAVLLGEEEPGELLKVPGKVLVNLAISLM